MSPDCGSCGLALKRLEVGICRLCTSLVVTVSPEHIRENRKGKAA